jgi:hypothetical protein
MLESELKREKDRANNAEETRKKEKERADSLDRRVFQQSLDISSAQYRASEESRRRADAENLLLSHSIYR